MRPLEKRHVARAFRIVSLPLLTFASVSCWEDGVAPNELLRALPDVSATEPISGCARFSVHVELSSAAVTVQNGVTCGQLVPEIDTTPVFDAARRALRLPIVLRNLSTSHVVAPVRVSFNADSIVRYRDGQSVPGSGSTRALNADSASNTGRSAAWKYDSLLAASGETQRLAPGASSRRMWLEFTGPELWLRPGGADADTTLSLRLDAAAMTMQVTSIPAQAPDSVPNGFYADSNLVPLLAGDSILIVKDIVLVAFEEDATQEQRSAAVSTVGGTVVGGSQTIAGDGIYFVRLPVSGADAVLNAISVLNNLQHVGAASPEIVMDSLTQDYLLPRDSTAVGQWQPNAHISTTDANWAFERVGAPLAWGCSTGAAATRIGIVDIGFHAIADLTPNIAGFPAYDYVDTTMHGTAVASITAAVGNNNSGMAGMMWRAGLRLYNRLRLWPGVLQVRHSTSRDIRLLTEAANDGARAINFSGNAGLERAQMTPQDSVRTDSVRRAVVRQLAFQIRRLESRGIEPVFILSAGNIDTRRPSANAYANGYTGIADEFPTRVMVVASSGTGDELLATSKRASIVSIAAPGAGVLALNRFNTIQVFGGTSVAAPLVTGAAGLLFSFDPRLTAAEVRSYLLLGAARGNRRTTPGNYPILNAYEALKAAAERPGAPLCGNRLWAVGDSVYARRGNTTERIAVVPTGVNRIIAFHGGRLLGIQSFAGSSPLFEWQNGSFTVTSRSPQAWEPVTGTSQSIFAGRSHNGDTTLTVLSGDVTLSVNQSPGGAIASVPIPGFSSTTVMKCLRRDWDFARDIYVCNDSMLIGTVTEFNSTSRGSISPQDEVVATVTRMQRRLVEELPDEPCPNATATPPSFCPKFFFEQLPLHTTVRILRRSTGAVLHQWQVVGAALAPVTFSEDGSELAAQESRVNSRSSVQMIGLTGGFGWSVQTTGLGETVVSCSNAFYAPHVGSVTLLQPRIENTAPNACLETLGNNTFSARIAANAPPAGMPRTAPPAAPRGKAGKKATSPARR